MVSPTVSRQKDNECKAVIFPKFEIRNSRNPTFKAINPLRPNTHLSQTSHCNIKGLSVSELMRIENMITQVTFY